MGNTFNQNPNINNNNTNNNDITELQIENDSFLISQPSSPSQTPIQIISSPNQSFTSSHSVPKPIEFYHSFHPLKNKPQLPSSIQIDNNNNNSNNSDYDNNLSFSSYDNDILSFIDVTFTNNNANTYLKKQSKLSTHFSNNNNNNSNSYPNIPLLCLNTSQHDINTNTNNNVNINFKSYNTSSHHKKASSHLNTIDESKQHTSSNSIIPQSTITRFKQFQRKNAMKKTGFLQSNEKTQIFPQKTIQYNYHDESSSYRTITTKNKSLNDKSLLLSLLSTIPFLKSITKEQAYELIEDMQYVQIEPQTLIIKQNSIGTNVFLIKKGKVKLCPLNFPNKIFTIKQSPFVLGERILINDTLRQWDVWSLTPIYAYVLKYKLSFNFIKNNIIICDKLNNRIVLDKCTTLHLLTDDQKDKLSLHMKKETYEEKETIINAYDRPNSVFILISGNVIDFTHSNSKTVIQPGNVFGYNNLIYPKNTQLKVQCNKQCICFSFVYDALKEVLEDEDNYLSYFRNIFIKQHLYNDPLFKDVSPLIENFILNNFTIKYYASDEIVVPKGVDVSETLYVVMEGDVYMENEHRIKLKEKHGTAVLFSDKVFSNEKHILTHDIKAYTDCFIAKIRKKTIVFHIGKTFTQAKKVLVVKNNLFNTKSFSNGSLLGINELDSLCNLIQEEVIPNEGSVIYNERDIADKMYVVVEGEVKVVSDGDNDDNGSNSGSSSEYMYKRKYNMFGINALSVLLYKSKINKNVPKIKYNEIAITSKRNTKLYILTRNNMLSCFNDKETILYYLLRRIYFMEYSFNVAKMCFFPLYNKSKRTFLAKRNPFEQQVLMFKAYSKDIYTKDYLLNSFQKTNKLIRKLDNIFLLKIISITFTTDYVYYLSPFITGNSLRTYLFNSSNNCFHLNYDLVRFYSIQLFIAIRTLHRSNLVHRLINHRTVLIDNHGYIKLTHVHTVSLLPIGKTSLINFKQGDLCYLAPEMLYGNNEYSYAVDYWAVGVLMYLMICGKLPFGLSFEEENKSNIVGAILNEELVFPSNVIDENFKDFIMKILDKVEDKRLKSWDDVICHPFYKGFKYRDIEMMEMKKPTEIKIIKSEVNVYKNEKYLSYEEMNMFLYNHSK